MPAQTHTLEWLDWLVIGAFLAATLWIGLKFAARGGSSVEAFFVSDRSLSWWIAGISMVATAFASDTPLWVTSLVRQYGIHYSWQYWSGGIGFGLAIVLFSKLWQRTGVLTDNELIELRYSGRAAATLRFWMGFFGATIGCSLVLGWVIKAMETIAREAMGLPPEFRIYSTVLVIGIALFSVMLSGLWGAMFTDLLQFGLAILGSTVLAVVALGHVGGLQALTEKLSTHHEWAGHEMSMIPSIGWDSTQMSVWNAIGYFGILWIGASYSGGYQAQRVLACKDGRNAALATFLFALLYIGVICWPWIITALCSVILYPQLPTGVSHDSIYPRMIMDLLPMGLKGLLVVALLGAFMSTVTTLLNWGSSYLVNDVYRRYLFCGRSDKHYVFVGRASTALIAVIGATMSLYGKSIQSMLEIVFVMGSFGTLTTALRWFWWRTTAVAELATTFLAIPVTFLLLFTPAFDAPVRTLFSTGRNLSTDPSLMGARMLVAMTIGLASVVLVSLFTRPTDLDKLRSFAIRVRPFPFGWRPVIQSIGAGHKPWDSVPRTLVLWLVVVASIYSLCFGVGQVLLGSAWVGAALLGVFAVTAVVSVRQIHIDFEREAINRAEAAGPAAEPGSESLK